MAKGSKFYVVWRGVEPGVFTTWAEAQRQTEGFAGARFKSFTSRAEAEAAFAAGAPPFIASTTKKSIINAPPRIVGKGPDPAGMAVDAACNMQTGQMEYQGVALADKHLIFHQGPFAGGTNNVGEYLALVHALAYCQKHSLHIPIYTDSKTALAWLRKKKHGSKLEPTPQNRPLFTLLHRADAWLSANTYANPVLKWETKLWGENLADFGRK